MGHLNPSEDEVIDADFPESSLSPESKPSDDVSQSLAKDYEVTYAYTPGNCPEDQALEAAAMLGKEQNSTSLLLDQLDENVESEAFQNAAMSISRLLNPDVEHDQSSSSLQTNVPKRTSVSLIESRKLNNKALFYLRKKHHSQSQRHKGNERDRVNADELQVAVASTNKDGRLDPSACSKIIAVHMKNQKNLSSGAKRRHRWNIHVKLNMAGLLNRTSLLGYKALQGLFDGGIISTQNPIEPGKFVIIIKNHVLYLGRTLVVYQHRSGKHCFVNTSTSQKELSHISVHILFYDPGLPVALSTCPRSGDAWTFALVDATDVAYVFPPSTGSNFMSLDGGCYSIPTPIREMLGGSDIERLISWYEGEVSKLKLNKRTNHIESD